MENKQTLSVCICTYQRLQLLSLLVDDLAAQTLPPGRLIVVDGDPGSGSVKEVLAAKALGFNVYYLPSNHPNLAYQRYLGWRVALACGGDFLLYLDDDLRIHNQQALAQLLAPMLEDERVAGVTADTSGGDLGALASQPALINTGTRGGLSGKIVDRFGAGRGTPPGGLAASGHRCFPERQESGFAEVQWLQGRVMLYRMRALSQDCFSDDMFALDHIHCDLGEDTFLSRQVGCSGKLLLSFGLDIQHPNADLPKCYPIEANKLGYARAYSRRFLNDHYRVTQPAKLSDRFDLLKSYAGNCLLNWQQAYTSREAYQIAYARGYLRGALRGIFQKPTAHSLTPEIDWWKDAEEALAQAVTIQ